MIYPSMAKNSNSGTKSILYQMIRHKRKALADEQRRLDKLEKNVKQLAKQLGIDLT